MSTLDALLEMADLELCAAVVRALKKANGRWTPGLTLASPVSGLVRREISEDDIQRAASLLIEKCERPDSRMEFVVQMERRKHLGRDRLNYRLVKREPERKIPGQLGMFGGEE